MTLAIRAIRADDAPDVLAAFQSNADMDRQGGVESLADAEHYLTSIDNDPNTQAFGLECDKHIVGLAMIAIDAENRNGWFSYWMHNEYRGRGWASRLAATVADYALDCGLVERLELGHRANNPASGAVACAAGFIQEGTERAKFLINGERIDVLTYGRLQTDAKPNYRPIPILG